MATVIGVTWKVVPTLALIPIILGVVILGVCIAFPVGYVCMKPWVEQFNYQITFAWWIYASIFVGATLLVALCVGWRVWKTAKTHPADEIAKGRG